MNDGSKPETAEASKGEVTKELDVLEDALNDSVALVDEMIVAIASVTQAGTPTPETERPPEETVVVVANRIRSLRCNLETSSEAMRSVIARISI